jgi:hypothetical protein
VGGFAAYATLWGYDPHNVMSVGIPVHDGTYPTGGALSTDQLLKKCNGSGVNMAAISATLRHPERWQTSVGNSGQTGTSRSKANQFCASDISGAAHSRCAGTHMG